MQVLGRRGGRRDRIADGERDLLVEKLADMAQPLRVAREGALPKAGERHGHHRHRRALKDLPDAGTERRDLAVVSDLALGEETDQLAGLERGGDVVVSLLQALRVFLRGDDRDGPNGAEEEDEESDAEDAVVHQPAG